MPIGTDQLAFSCFYQIRDDRLFVTKTIPCKTIYSPMTTTLVSPITNSKMSQEFWHLAKDISSNSLPPCSFLRHAATRFVIVFVLLSRTTCLWTRSNITLLITKITLSDLFVSHLILKERHNAVLYQWILKFSFLTGEDPDLCLLSQFLS